MTHVLTAIKAAATVAFAFSGLHEHAGWLWGLLALCAGAMLFMRARHFALGLRRFTASGTQVAVDAGARAIVAVLMGVVTAAFGGVLHDTVCNEIPSAFRD